MAQALVGQLINADLRVWAGVADLEANDLPRSRVRGQRRGGVDVQPPLPHAKEINPAHVGQARPQTTEAREQRVQVLLGPLQDDIDREVAAGRRGGGLGRTRMTLRKVGQHGGERLKDSGVASHRSVDAGQDQGDESATGVDTPRRLVRRLNEADLRLGRETRENVVNLRERRPQVLKFAHRAAEHFHEGIGPLDGGGHRAQGCGEHATQDERRDMVFVPESAGPRLEKSSEGHAAVSKAAADNRLHGRFKRVAQVSTRVQGVHSSLERSHRRRTIRPRIAVSPIPSVQVIEEGGEPGSLLSPGATRLNNDRCIQIHDSPFSPLPLSLRGSVCAT